MTDTDPVPEEDNPPAYGFFARLIGLPVLEQHLKEFIMATIDPITTAQTAQGAALVDLSDQIGKLAGQIADLQAGTVTQAQIDAAAATATSIASAITDAAAAVDAALEVEGEDDVAPPVEPVGPIGPIGPPVEPPTP